MAKILQINNRQPRFVFLNAQGERLDVHVLTPAMYDTIQDLSDNTIADVKQLVVGKIINDALVIAPDAYLTQAQADAMTSAEISDWRKAHKDR